MTTLKQESASEDSAAAIEGIAKMFRAADMPRLAEESLYIGIPHPILKGFHAELERQRAEHEDKRFRNRMRYAGILRERAEATFKWDDDTYPLAAPGLIEQILTASFVRQKRNLVIAGPPGAGKTLLAVILACKALRDGLSVKYKTAHDIAAELREARSGNSLSGYVKKMQAYDMLVMEDLTFSSFDARAAQSFFSIVDKRYGRKTTLITTNANVKEWAGRLPDKSMCSALLGRFYEEALVLNMNGAKDMRLGGAGGAPGGIGDEKEALRAGAQ